MLLLHIHICRYKPRYLVDIDRYIQTFKTTQDNVNSYDLLKQLSELTRIKDIDKLDNFADIILDNIRQNARIDLSDGLDKRRIISRIKRFIKITTISSISISIFLFFSLL